MCLSPYFARKLEGYQILLVLTRRKTRKSNIKTEVCDPMSKNFQKRGVCPKYCGIYMRVETALEKPHVISIIGTKTLWRRQSCSIM